MTTSEQIKHVHHCPSCHVWAECAEPCRVDPAGGDAWVSMGPDRPCQVCLLASAPPDACPGYQGDYAALSPCPRDWTCPTCFGGLGKKAHDELVRASEMMGSLEAERDSARQEVERRLVEAGREPAPEPPPYITSGFLRVERTIMHPAPEPPAAEDDDERLPTAAEGAEAVARLGIDVPAWAAEIRQFVAAAQAPAAEAGRCKLPPPGWTCSRGAGHDGPCAASPAAEPCSHCEANATTLLDALAERDSARHEVERLRGELESRHDEENDTLRCGLTIQKNRLKKAKAERDEARQEVERLRAALGEAEEARLALLDAPAARAELAAAISNLDAARAAYGDVIAARTADLERYTAMVNEARAELAQSEAIRDNLGAELVRVRKPAAEAGVCVACGGRLPTMTQLDRQLSLEAEVERLTAELARLRENIAEVIEVAHRHGWNGVENSKILASFVDGELSELARLRAPVWTEEMAQETYSAALAAMKRKAPPGAMAMSVVNAFLRALAKGSQEKR